MRGRFVLLVICTVAAFSYGFIAGAFKIFPYRTIGLLGQQAPNRAVALRKADDQFPATTIVFSFLGDSSFQGHTGGPETTDVFDVVAADMELDGDVDLLINRHHLSALELYENLGGRFQRVNVPGADASGLFDNRGIPDLYAEQEEMVASIQRDAVGGLYVWHDRERRTGLWRFYLKGEAKRWSGLTLSLRFNSSIKTIAGLVPADYELTDGSDLRVSMNEDLMVGIGLESPAGQLKIHLGAEAGREPPPLFVGPKRIPMPTADASLWEPDPHGMAWVQAEGSPEPDLFIARGGLKGELLPPKEPKGNALFVWQGQKGVLYRMADEGVLPLDYGRGRKVEWVDINNDAVNDLYVGNAYTPNALLMKNAETGRYEDQASRLGLGFVGPGVFTWMDLNEDGFQDLFFLSDDRIVVARSLEGVRFQIIDGRDLGLVLPKGAPAADRALFDSRALHLVDFNNDGELDVWVSGWDPRLTNHLFLGRQGRYVAVTEQVRLTPIEGTRQLLLLDVDNDSFVDALSVGTEVVLLRSIHGAYLRAERFEIKAETGRGAAATTGDFDGDGRIDVVWVGKKPSLALNREDRGNGFLSVHLGPIGREPIGAVVRAHYADGRIQAQRYGSAGSSGFSQALQPLHFGFSKEVSLKAIGVRWPSSGEEVLYPVDTLNTDLRIERSSRRNSSSTR